ncbi:metallophosphoesterase family protein [Thermotalea metallivorans]|uniref:Phosphoesterase n=1 Tax=Thermotalea metallivorans TaxID=520762 RepID=A0A140L1H1_9FIRM|nr:metallophosphoesterase family protein [Thermotalea metallivorans]KXG74396.1 hypothetical protein AN619_23790 [Thermotalea metallivorans]
MTTRLAFISDIHGNEEALKAVLEDISKRSIDFQHVYALGDIVGYGPKPNEAIALLQRHGIRSVLGNYDEAVGFFLPTCGCHITSKEDQARVQNALNWTARYTTESNKAFLRELEEQIILEIEGWRILLNHASPFSINDYVYEKDEEKQEEIALEIEEDMIVHGHTHYPYYKQVKGKWFINPGSVGRPKDGDPRACYCIVGLEQQPTVEFVRVLYDVEKVAKEIEASELLDVFAQILRQGKDIK